MSGNIEEEIKALESTLCRLKDLQKQQCAAATQVVRKWWEPVGGDWWITSNQEVIPATTSINCEMATLYGSRRPTLQQAKRAAVEMRRFNRLLALRDELCGDDLPNWESEITDKWRVYRDNRAGEWNVGKNQYMQDVGVYFTKEEHAQRACDMLNSGEVIL